MTSSRGGDPSDPIGPLKPTGAGGISQSRGVEEAQGAQSVSGVDAVGSAQAVQATEASGAVQGTDAIAQALATGAIDASEAKAQLIDEVVRTQLPAGADPALVAEVRAEVEALLAADPILEKLLTP